MQNLDSLRFYSQVQQGELDVLKAAIARLLAVQQAEDEDATDSDDASDCGPEEDSDETAMS